MRHRRPDGNMSAEETKTLRTLPESSLDRRRISALSTDSTGSTASTNSSGSLSSQDEEESQRKNILDNNANNLSINTEIIRFFEEQKGALKWLLQLTFLAIVATMLVLVALVLAYIVGIVGDLPKILDDRLVSITDTKRNMLRNEDAWREKIWHSATNLLIRSITQNLAIPLITVIMLWIYGLLRRIEFFEEGFPVVGKYLFKENSDYFDLRVNVSLNMLEKAKTNGTSSSSNTVYDLQMRTIAEMSMQEFFGGSKSEKLFNEFLKIHRRDFETKKKQLRNKWFPFVATKPASLKQDQLSQITKKINDQIRNRLSTLFRDSYFRHDMQGTSSVICKEYAFGVTFEEMQNGQNEKWRVLLIQLEKLKWCENSTLTLHDQETKDKRKNLKTLEKLKRSKREDERNDGEVGESIRRVKHKLEALAYSGQRWEHLKLLNRVVHHECNDDLLSTTVDRLGGLLVGKLWISTAR